MGGLNNNSNLFQIILKFFDRTPHIGLKFVFFGYSHLVDFGGLRFHRRSGRGYRFSGIIRSFLGGRNINTFALCRAYPYIDFSERLFKIIEDIKQMVGPVVVYFFQLFIRFFNNLGFSFIFFRSILRASLLSKMVFWVLDLMSCAFLFLSFLNLSRSICFFFHSSSILLLFSSTERVEVALMLLASPRNSSLSFLIFSLASVLASFIEFLA